MSSYTCQEFAGHLFLGGGGGGGCKTCYKWTQPVVYSQDNTCSNARTESMCVAYYMQIYETKCTGYKVFLFPIYCLVKYRLVYNIQFHYLVLSKSGQCRRNGASRINPLHLNTCI